MNKDEICNNFGLTFIDYYAGLKTIWLCWTKLNLQEKRIVKTLDDHFKRGNDIILAENEIYALCNLNHPNIIKIYKWASFDNKHKYAELEFFNALDLFYIREQFNYGRFPQQLIKIIMKQLIDALIYCHKKKIVHRDLKLENILYDVSTQQLKIIDFAFACFLDNSCCEIKTRSCGTLQYMSPELLLNQPYPACTSDTFGLGVLLYMMVYGKFPYSDENYQRIEFKKIEDHPPVIFPNYENIEHVDELKDLLHSLLAIKLEDRIHLDNIVHSAYYKYII
jgi:serine/threonine protein kinase